jgi:drug/metabolite transporter (DMT)-like permease
MSVANKRPITLGELICLGLAAFLLGAAGSFLTYVAMQYAAATVHAEADTED